MRWAIVGKHQMPSIFDSDKQTYRKLQLGPIMVVIGGNKQRLGEVPNARLEFRTKGSYEQWSISPLLAQSRHRLVHRTCPLLGVKQTCRLRCQNHPSQTLGVGQASLALRKFTSCL